MRSCESHDPRHRNATAAVISQRLAEDCFSPAMQKPSRSRPAASAALPLLHPLPWPAPPARSDGPASAVHVIGMHGRSRAAAPIWRRSGAIASPAGLRPSALSLSRESTRRRDRYRPGHSVVDRVIAFIGELRETRRELWRQSAGRIGPELRPGERSLFRRRALARCDGTARSAWPDRGQYPPVRQCRISAIKVTTARPGTLRSAARRGGRR